MTKSRPAAHFERLYQSHQDPWEFETSSYEKDKFHRTLGVLGGRRFSAALEIGCSIGVLTRMLAQRCDAVLGVDIVEQPLHVARLRCADQTHVRFQRMHVPASWPEGHFDLIVFSEVLYFLSMQDIDLCIDGVRASLLPGGVVVLVNWLGKTDDPTSGNAAAEHFISKSPETMPIVFGYRNEKYRLDVMKSI